MKNELLGKFRIGDRVIVKGEYRTGYTGGDKKNSIEIVYKNSRFGIVCGASHKYLGTYKDVVDDEYDQPYLSVEKVITTWKVRLGLLNLPLDCLTEQLQKTEIIFDIPIRYYANKEI
jgi:hypothetical protein